MAYKNPTDGNSVACGVAILNCFVPDGVALSAQEIADMVGCSKTHIQKIEYDGWAKIKKSAPHLIEYLED